MRRTKQIAILALLGWWIDAAGAAAQPCQAKGVVLQILGSNGPRIKPNGASASYLIWIDGRSRVLVEADASTTSR
jgi:hypothetical protein